LDLGEESVKLEQTDLRITTKRDGKVKAIKALKMDAVKD